MGEKRAYKPRKPGGGRRKSKPEYDAEKILKELMDSAVVLYDAGMSLQAIADELGLNPIKVRKLLITAGVYVSDMAEKVQVTLDFYLRENAKSRPLFAGDERISKEEFRLFYDREDEERRYLENYENMEKRQLRKMTHIERFSYDVLGDMKEEECVLLFDYQNRNPLDHQAKVFCVTEEIRELCKQ